MKITEGKKEVTIANEKRKAIIEIEFTDYILYVFQGTITDFDIIVKYKKGEMRIRTPKHIHWAVDILIKMQGQKKLVKKFLNSVKNVWNNCSPLQNNDYETLKGIIDSNVKTINITEYQKLNNYGEYPVDFLFVLMLLLSLQEKTNRPDAYMFGKIIDELLESDYDIFKVISTAGYSGR